MICDTAGRLHNKKNLMDELVQNRPNYRPGIAGLRQGNPAWCWTRRPDRTRCNQAREFQNAAGITGIVLTKARRDRQRRRGDGNPGRSADCRLNLSVLGSRWTICSRSMQKNLPAHCLTGRGYEDEICDCHAQCAQACRIAADSAVRLGIDAVTADLTEAEETGTTFAENAFLKAESACRETRNAGGGGRFRPDGRCARMVRRAYILPATPEKTRRMPIGYEKLL